MLKSALDLCICDSARGRGAAEVQCRRPLTNFVMYPYPGAGPYRAPAHCARLEFAKHCWRPLTYNDKLARGKMAHVAADSSSSSMADQLSVSLGQEYRVKLGRSFTFPEQNSFHTIKCKKFRPRPIYNACNVIYMCSDI